MVSERGGTAYGPDLQIFFSRIIMHVVDASVIMVVLLKLVFISFVIIVVLIVFLPPGTGAYLLDLHSRDTMVFCPFHCSVGEVEGVG